MPPYIGQSIVLQQLLIMPPVKILASRTPISGTADLFLYGPEIVRFSERRLHTKWC